jgi:hypothetical protein
MISAQSRTRCFVARDGALGHADLRRTARSKLSRLVRPDIAERVLGHAIPGIKGVDDHYD